MYISNIWVDKYMYTDIQWLIFISLYDHTHGAPNQSCTVQTWSRPGTITLIEIPGKPQGLAVCRNYRNPQRDRKVIHHYLGGFLRFYLIELLSFLGTRHQSNTPNVSQKNMWVKIWRVFTCVYSFTIYLILDWLVFVLMANFSFASCEALGHDGTAM